MHGDNNRIVYVITRSLCILLVCWACDYRPAQADIYSYVDENGVIHFTNVPTSSKYKIYMRHSTPPKKRAAKLSARDYDDLIAEAALAHGVSSHLIKAIIRAESNFNPHAVSQKGAKGLMQIMPENYPTLNISDPFDPRENIMGGVRYFKRMLKRFKGDVILSLAAYNAGPGAVERHNAIPPIEETKNYVRKVLLFYQKYRNG
jgi:soluble lytic murein transglycosylase-like protein